MIKVRSVPHVDDLKKSIKECVRCHQTSKQGGRGLCVNCYSYLRRNGRIEEYPRTLAESNSKEPCRECGNIIKIYSHGLCKKCYNKLPKWKAYHAEDMRNRRRDNREEYNAKERERHKRRSESRKPYNKKYYEDNRELLIQYQVIWRQNNREKYKGYMHDARVRKRNAEGKTTLKQWLSIVGYYCPNNRCIACGKEFNSNIQTNILTLDHIIPLIKGGTNWPCNIQPICYSCNSSKSDSRLTDYRWDNGEFTKSLMENNQ